MNFFQNRNKLTDLENKFMVATGEERGGGMVKVWNKYVHITIFKMNNQQIPIL